VCQGGVIEAGRSWATAAHAFKLSRNPAVPSRTTERVPNSKLSRIVDTPEVGDRAIMAAGASLRTICPHVIGTMPARLE
jgi:hypothetical protein